MPEGALRRDAVLAQLGDQPREPTIRALSPVERARDWYSSMLEALGRNPAIRIPMQLMGDIGAIQESIDAPVKARIQSGVGDRPVVAGEVPGYIGGPLGEAGAARALAEGTGEAKGIRAFHGSPHEFEKFKLSEVGTGEGGQMYGHGLYFAENEKVAKMYRERLARGTFPPDDVLAKYFTPGEIVPGYAGMDRVVEFRPTTREAGFAVKVERVDPKTGNATEPPRWHATMPSEQNVNQVFEQRGLPKWEPGHSYEVSIKADPEHLLDWDKPLTEQSPQVLEALQRDPRLSELSHAREWPGSEYEPPSGNLVPLGRKSGADLYEALVSELGGRSAHTQGTASATLREAGIPGVKYLDQGSRQASLVDERLHALVEKHAGNVEAAVDALGRSVYLPPKEKAAWRTSMIENYKPLTRNFVVFDDKLIDILRKYALLGAIGGGAAGAASQSEK